MGFTKNKELTDEIVSDVFINIWRRRKNVEEIKNLKLYLYVSAKNITFNYLKKLIGKTWQIWILWKSNWKIRLPIRVLL